MTDTHHHDPQLTRVQALLDKAASTPFEAEAEALMGKAQELMARHAIDEAMLATGASADQIADEHLTVEPPYANAKATLLAATAHANRCRVAKANAGDGRLHCTVVGHRTDLANVRVLYTALALQGVRFMLAATPPPGETARRFRQSFLLAYAHRIGERLREAERTAAGDAQDSQLDHAQGRSVSLVLASRTAKVDRAFATRFPGARTARISGSSAAGFRSGRAAADRAALGDRPLDGTGPALPGDLG